MTKYQESWLKVIEEDQQETDPVTAVTKDKADDYTGDTSTQSLISRVFGQLNTHQCYR